MTDEQAAWVVAQLRAAGAQIAANDKLTEIIGTQAPAPAPKSLNERITEYAATNHLNYAQAVERLRIENPEAFKE
jgi:hypothetical protein